MIAVGIHADRCRSCGAAIIWARTNSGTPIPVDAEPDRPRGTLALDVRDDVVRCYVAQGDYPQGRRHRPHLASCPDIDGWRYRR